MNDFKEGILSGTGNVQGEERKGNTILPGLDFRDDCINSKINAETYLKTLWLYTIYI